MPVPILDAWNPSSCVKLIKQGSDSAAKPVWVMPVMGGTTACFDELFNSFDGYKRTLYGLTDPFLVGNDEALTASFGDWIDMYVSAMLSKQSSGPFTLIGYSQGMNWVWAVSEALASKGHKTEAVVILDPNFPSWNGLDRAAAWNGPQLAKAEGAPLFIIRRVMGMLMAGLGKKAMWETQAKREATVASFISEQSKTVDHFEDLIIQMEMDTGKEPGLTQCTHSPLHSCNLLTVACALCVVQARRSSRRPPPPSRSGPSASAPPRPPSWSPPGSRACPRRLLKSASTFVPPRRRASST